MAKNAGKSEALRCPECGSSKIVRILYGLPQHPAPAIDRSKYVRWGCTVRPENALCDSCGHSWPAN